MNLIVAVDNNWAIGCKNRLLVSIPGIISFSVRRPRGKWWCLAGRRWRLFRRACP